MEVISRDGTTAQIDPLRFCQWLLKEVKERGVRIHQPARATAIVHDSEDVLCGLKISTSHDAESDTECKISIMTATFPCLLTRYNSTMYTSCHNVWRLVPSRIQHPLPVVQSTHSHLLVSWPLTARPKPIPQT
jgi:hypothetical protein